jgi:hypothetical protein
VKLRSLARALAHVSIGALAACILVAPAGAKSSKAKNDRDHMPNGWEKKHELDVRVNDSRGDPDADLLRNIAEFKNKTDPQDADTDGDGFGDGQEILDGYDPTDAEDNLDADLADEALGGGGQGLEEEDPQA